MSGTELKEMLAKTGIPQVEIANRLGVLPQSLSNWFNAADVKTGTLERLSEVLGLSIAWFYGQEMREQTNEQLLSLLRDKDKQIDRLLGIIEAMSGAAKKDTA